MSLLIKLRLSCLVHRWPYPILAILFMPFGCIAPKTFNYLAFQSFEFKHTWWRLFQKRVVHTKFDIYVFISDVILTSISTLHVLVETVQQMGQWILLWNSGSKKFFLFCKLSLMLPPRHIDTQLHKDFHRINLLWYWFRNSLSGNSKGNWKLNVHMSM